VVYQQENKFAPGCFSVASLEKAQMILLIAIVACYSLLLIVGMVGWRKMLRAKVSGQARSQSRITILIACRNEAHHISSLIASLSVLQYPKENYEVILIDDHSTDGTLNKIQSLIKNLGNFRLLRADESMHGKKKALSLGVSHSKFEIMATTDADCQVPADWLSYISLFFEDSHTHMLAGGVSLRDHSFFSELQKMEFSGVVGATASAFGLGHPIMANGANLAFRKEVFKEVNGYEGNMHIASGDDEFMMRKVRNAYPEGIRFMNFSESVVFSEPQHGVRNFVSQRIRWAGKWKSNPDLVTRILAVFIVLSQLSFFTLLLMYPFEPGLPAFSVLLKMLLELIFIFMVTRFLGIKVNLLIFFVLQILYPIYVIVIGFLSLGASYRWKDRNYNP
jgi:poly-beta-1,6-N-acetyl-D-glucosamine synthase